MKDEKVVARLPRNATTELVIRTGEYWNIKIVDMRWYVNGSHTHKGLRVNVDEAKTLLRALQKILGDTNEHEQELDED
tara:strand:+ start:892 stop:1125 length:234 start_codon:yes stop_codon:yes gene_type:complete